VGPLRQSTPLRRGPSEVTYGWDPWDRFIFLRGHKTRTALTTIRGMPAGILAGFGGIVATDQGIKPPVCASLIGLSSHTEATSTITANPSAKTKFRRGPIPLHAAELPPLCVLVHTGGGGGGAVVASARNIREGNRSWCGELLAVVQAPPRKLTSVWPEPLPP
jgi:hypothetical protein